MELLGETPNGLSADVTVPRDDRQRQHYFSELRLQKYSQLFIRTHNKESGVLHALRRTVQCD